MQHEQVPCSPSHKRMVESERAQAVSLPAAHSATLLAPEALVGQMRFPPIA